MARTKIYAPGEHIRVQDRRWKHISGNIYQDTDSGMFYRIIEDHIATMHGDLEYALWAEKQYLNMQMEQINRDIDLIFESYEARKGRS